jgi:hypothetical protein
MGSLDAHTKGVNRNTNALDEMRGMYDGGPRFRSALARSFGPEASFDLNKAIRSQANRVGPYAIGM